MSTHAPPSRTRNSFSTLRSQAARLWLDWLHKTSSPKIRSLAHLYDPRNFSEFLRSAMPPARRVPLDDPRAEEVLRDKFKGAQQGTGRGRKLGSFSNGINAKDVAPTSQPAMLNGVTDQSLQNGSSQVRKANFCGVYSRVSFGNTIHIADFSIAL